MCAVLLIAFVIHRSSYIRRKMDKVFFFLKFFFLSGKGVFGLFYLLLSPFL